MSGYCEGCKVRDEHVDALKAKVERLNKIISALQSERTVRADYVRSVAVSCNTCEHESADITCDECAACLFGWGSDDDAPINWRFNGRYNLESERELKLQGMEAK